MDKQIDEQKEQQVQNRLYRESLAGSSERKIVFPHWPQNPTLRRPRWRDEDHYYDVRRRYSIRLAANQKECNSSKEANK
jgi:hypothetical protein